MASQRFIKMLTASAQPGPPGSVVKEGCRRHTSQVFGEVALIGVHGAKRQTCSRGAVRCLIRPRQNALHGTLKIGEAGFRSLHHDGRDIVEVDLRRELPRGDLLGRRRVGRHVAPRRHSDGGSHGGVDHLRAGARGRDSGGGRDADGDAV